jgi:FkbM family methyltransferase
MAIGDRIRDFATNSVVSLPVSFSESLTRRFPRATLWSLFHLYGKEPVIAPAGPRDCRFRMWLDAQMYTDYITGLYEKSCTQVLREHLRQASLVLDIGANLGYFSIFMAKHAGGNCQILAFEPMPDTFGLLERNIKLNNLTNVNAIKAAVSDKSGDVELLSDARQRLSKTASIVGYRLEGEAKKTTAQAIRIDQYFEGAEQLPDLIKVDVEGGELAVLNGARAAIRRGRPTLVIEIHGWGSEDSQKVLDLLADVGYSANILEIRTPEALCLAKPIL